ncbi:hypothetical protein SDC9_16502 [bioreactor metagenome]|uniref:Uncharacterized protein n=1 Tax=bioreactor metagenome TaxID=1076179 RepID=A0A644TYM3_9ZZZZ
MVVVFGIPRSLGFGSFMNKKRHVNRDFGGERRFRISSAVQILGVSGFERRSMQRRIIFEPTEIVRLEFAQGEFRQSRLDELLE